MKAEFKMLVEEDSSCSHRWDELLYNEVFGHNNQTIIMVCSRCDSEAEIVLNGSATPV